jgi:dihydrofolate synthase/folylpolyglutamate synthase
MSGRRADSILARLHGLYPVMIDLSMDRLLGLLDKLGRPQERLPPVIHVAGTNGKGSTCAFLRAIAEAAGWRVHVYTSPHLVEFRERFRVAGTLVSEAALTEALDQVERTNAGGPITVFEAMTAVAFVLFAQTPADLCVLEVGLGGRGDATNVIAKPAVCAITSISMDHQDFLGDTLAAIAGEKAGIIKPGVPVVTGQQEPDALETIAARAAELGAPLRQRGRDWSVTPTETGLCYTDANGRLDLPPPALLGPHQLDNAGIAVAALRAAFTLEDAAFARGIAGASWPARLQILPAELPAGWELWLDGGHNPGAGAALARHLPSWSDRPIHLVVGMKQTKDAAGFLRPLLPHAASVWAVAEPGQHLALPVEAIVAASGGQAQPGPTVEAALNEILARYAPGRILICGSLFLAGEVLKRFPAGA